MIRDLTQLVQNYSDAVFAGFTKTAPDGRTVFYPWGAFGRGYVIASEEDERRLKQKYAVLVVVAPILMGAGYAVSGYLGVLAVGALSIVCTAIYVARLTANMEPSGERLSLTEAFRAQACKHTLRRLWSWTIAGIFLICLGIVVSVLTPEDRAGAALVIGIGVVISAFGGSMLALRRGANPSAAGPLPTGKSLVAEEVAAYITGDVGPVRAWTMAILGLLFVALGIFWFIIDPAERSSAAGLVAVCGLIAAFGVAMLVLRYRERHK